MATQDGVGADAAADQSFEPNDATFVNLGRTGVRVCRIGVGGGSGMSNDVLEYAISRGVNYIFYSSDLHNALYGRSGSVLRQYVRRGSRRRDQVVLVAASYVCDPEKILGAIVDQLRELKMDHVDVFHWGWVTRANGPAALVEQTDGFVRSAEGRAFIDDFVGVTRQVADELRCRGYARFLGISTHDRNIAAEMSRHPLVDVVMFRYNIAHRGAERQIFPEMPANRPGTVAFNTSHDGGGALTEPPRGLPPGKYRPTQSELYRFALDRPEIDVVLTGPITREHVDSAFDALEGGPLDPRLREYLCKYGALHRGKAMIAR